jgi:hypothetical protein
VCFLAWVPSPPRPFEAFVEMRESLARRVRRLRVSALYSGYDTANAGKSDSVKTLSSGVCEGPHFRSDRPIATREAARPSSAAPARFSSILRV